MLPFVAINWGQKLLKSVQRESGREASEQTTSWPSISQPQKYHYQTWNVVYTLCVLQHANHNVLATLPVPPHHHYRINTTSTTMTLPQHCHNQNNTVTTTPLPQHHRNIPQRLIPLPSQHHRQHFHSIPEPRAIPLTSLDCLLQRYHYHNRAAIIALWQLS